MLIHWLTLWFRLLSCWRYSVVWGPLNPKWAGFVEAPPSQTGADEAVPTWPGTELVVGKEQDGPEPGGPDTGGMEPKFSLDEPPPRLNWGTEPDAVLEGLDPTRVALEVVPWELDPSRMESEPPNLIVAALWVAAWGKDGMEPPNFRGPAERRNILVSCEIKAAQK